MQSRLLKFTNSRGESITFSDDSSFIISQIEGLGDVDADVQMQKSPFQDGSTHIDTNLVPRSISFTVTIIGNSDTDISQKRSRLSGIFNPKLGEGLLEYKYGDIVRQIYALAEHVPNFPTGGENRGFNHQVALINLIAPNPYWQTVHVSSKQMSFIMGGLSFPLQLGTVFSQRSFRRIFNNEGDVPTPVKIEFKGPAINPIIRNNTTGEFVQVNRTLAETDTLVINTAFGEKSVAIVDEEGNSENAFNWIDLESTFFQLEVGENELEYNSNNDSTKSRVVISYRHRYVGV